MNKILVFIFDGMTDYEVTFITHLLSTSGNKEIITFAYDKNSVKGRSGFEIIPSRELEEISNEEVEGIIIPGGWYGDFRPALIELIKDLNKKGKLLAGICGAGTVALAMADILEKVKYTTPAFQWTEKHKGIFCEIDPFPRYNFINERVVRDKNIITAIGPAFIDFAIEICDWFNLFESDEEKVNFIKEFLGHKF